MADNAPDSGTHSTAMAEDGVTALPNEDVGKDKAAEELEDAHRHADPSRTGPKDGEETENPGN
jgi:hypothetical protein